MPPRAVIDPIHDISSIVGGPVISGVFSDANCGNAGDDQPDVHPWVNAIKFTEKMVFKGFDLNIFNVDNNF